jgi:hypothetical protein
LNTVDVFLAWQRWLVRPFRNCERRIVNISGTCTGSPRFSEAKRYAEGTAVRIDVKSPTDRLIVKQIAAEKFEN